VGHTAKALPTLQRTRLFQDPMLTRPGRGSQRPADVGGCRPRGSRVGPLSNDVAVVDANTSDGASGASENHEGVLLNLPRTRPQRASARRASSRASNGSAARPRKPANSKPATAAAVSETTGAKRRSSGNSVTAAAKPRTTAKRRVQVRRRATSVAAEAEAAPRQGFESEAEAPSGTVHPPGGGELVASAAEIVGELAKAGLSTGERLLKDVLSRMPLS
jgi:hypothetical protein